MTSGNALTILSSVIKRVLINREVRLYYAAGAYGPGMYRTVVCIVLINDMMTGRSNHMTRIDIVSGFLGAGKTTFIQRLLDEALKT